MNFFEHLRYYDFQVLAAPWQCKEEYMWINCKLPAYDLRKSIIQLFIMMDPPLFVYFPNSFGNVVMSGEFTHKKVEFLIRQIREYQLVSARGKTVQQYRLLSTYQRHHFTKLFEDKYNAKGGTLRIKKGTNGR